jgi:hypothetical protein
MNYPPERNELSPGEKKLSPRPHLLKAKKEPHYEDPLS